MYVNVHAMCNSDGKDFPTKKALKTAIQTNPADVYFAGTSGFTVTGGTLDILDKGVKYSVCGPNPHTNRKWYATVEITQSGAIRIS